jgi:hypothetical protein
MDVLREALRDGRIVEIHHLRGGVSGSPAAAQESANRASAANARGERAAHAYALGAKPPDARPVFRSMVNAQEVAELLRLGAVDVLPEPLVRTDQQRPKK